MNRRIVLSVSLILLVLLPAWARAIATPSQPQDFFKDFPGLKFGMSFAEARKAVEATGAQPVGSDKSQTELTWDGKFNELNGRATLLFKPNFGLWEIAVVVYAMEKRKELFSQWTSRIVDKHGPATESDTTTDTSRLWKLKDNVLLELRLIKDDNSPVIDIHWVLKNVEE
jgi:hypothetical protein